MSKLPSTTELFGVFKIWDTKKGLLGFLLIWLILSITFFPKFAKFLGFDSFPFAHIISVSGLIIYYLLWRYRRSFSFLRNHINIIFAIYNIDGSDEVDRAIKNLKNRLWETIENFNFKNVVLVDFKPTDFLIKSKEKAQKLVQEGYIGSTLIVWGEAYQFRNEIKCPVLHFTYEFAYKRYYSKPPEFYKGLFRKPIQKSIAALRWNFALDLHHTLEEYVINLSEVCIFILARILLSVRKYKKALDLLDKLYDSFQGLSWMEQKKRGPLITSVQDTLISLCNSFSLESYFRHDLSGMERYSSKALALDKHSYSANLSAAICAEEKDDREKAKEFTSRAESNAPKNSNTHIFNLAYFALDEGRLQEAIERFRHLIKYSANFHPVIVADFHRGRYIKTKKIEFLFAEGLIKINWFEKPHDGEKIIKKFLKEALKDKASEIKYKLLIEEAKRLLNSEN